MKLDFLLLLSQVFAILCIGGVLAGNILILIAAFREGILWGLACLFLPIVTLFFIITHFAESKVGFFIYLAGIGFGVLSVLCGSSAPAV